MPRVLHRRRWAECNATLPAGMGRRSCRLLTLRSSRLPKLTLHFTQGQPSPHLPILGSFAKALLSPTAQKQVLGFRVKFK